MEALEAIKALSDGRNYFKAIQNYFEAIKTIGFKVLVTDGTTWIGGMRNSLGTGPGLAVFDSLFSC